MSDTIKNKKLNFRDLGGLETEDGKKVRKGLLLRSAKLNKLTPHDKSVLESKYRVSAVIDFRSDDEREGRADILPSGAKYYHIPIFSETTLAVTGGMGSDVFEAVKKAESKDQKPQQAKEDQPFADTERDQTRQASQALFPEREDEAGIPI